VRGEVLAVLCTVYYVLCVDCVLCVAYAYSNPPSRVKIALPSLDLPKVRRNALIEIIPLSTGCLGSCTYCKTKHARGKLGSYALEAIVDRAKKAIEEGVAEIWLSSEDTGTCRVPL
jgi:tRNA A37 methylthiotransferase MiaB